MSSLATLFEMQSLLVFWRSLKASAASEDMGEKNAIGALRGTRMFPTIAV
jgi:hypothetical protein